MKQPYEIPIFSRPVTSPDFKAYISRPRRRRFHDPEIWPDRYQAYLDKKTLEKLNKFRFRETNQQPINLRDHQINQGPHHNR